MQFAWRAINRVDAEQIVGWRYAVPYDRYNLAESDVAGLLVPRNNYFVADDADDRLVGFCCFGADARVSGGSYGDETGLDVGVGLRPDVTGRSEEDTSELQ